MVLFKPLKRLIRSAQTRYFSFLVPDIVTRQMESIREAPDSPFMRKPRQGFLRGIDFYEAPDLLRAMTLSMANFRRIHGVIPDLVHPVGFNEKIVWSKFFSEIKVPESGNKLLTGSFIPDGLKSLIGCPPIVWHSREPRLPENDELEPGYYYLKASHGSSMFRRIRYPLPDRERAELERQCARWLSLPYGLKDGEWWYNVFDKEVLLDRDVAGQRRSVAVDVFVFRGNIEYVLLHRKGDAGVEEGQELTRLDGDFNPVQAALQPKSPAIDPKIVCAEARRNMKHFATRIGENFPFVRVDFVLGIESIHLIEITFSPANAHAKRPPELDRWLGEKWIL
jgi:hypothetical protein